MRLALAGAPIDSLPEWEAPLFESDQPEKDADEAEVRKALADAMGAYDIERAGRG